MMAFIDNHHAIILYEFIYLPATGERLHDRHADNGGALYII